MTAWALTTSEGIILFDAMFHHNVKETVVDSFVQLGWMTAIHDCAGEGLEQKLRAAPER